LSHIYQVLVVWSVDKRTMSIYEEIEVEDMTFDDETQTYTYPCPCGDKFEIGLDELLDGEDVALCPSCTLRIRVIYEEEDLPQWQEERWHA